MRLIENAARYARSRFAPPRTICEKGFGELLFSFPSLRHAQRIEAPCQRSTFERVLLAVLAAGASSGAPRPSHAQPGLRPVLVSWENGTPRVTFRYRDLFDAETVQHVRSGLQVTIVMRVWALPEGRGDPLGFAARSCRIAYDVWDENFRVEVLDPAGLRTVALPTLDAVVAQCGEVRGLPLRMTRALHPGEPYHFATIAEVDPLTPDMVARIQRWIAQPGDRPVAAPAGHFFGNFVALFVNPTVNDAERTLRFDSGPQVAP